ncbi:MAG TPA: Gfo/Idh/MocA family oxidoreductase [Steroidobacteraceae bacterium]|nr:Gfo/Idh/MocA family oxidoreductase [Steroidobacteraceae bacterium]
MKKLGMGLVGPGFVAAHHIDAVRRLGDVEVIAIAGSSLDSARRRAQELQVDRAYGDYRELLSDPAIDVVHNTTPNYLHLEISLAALRAGKHVISEKPLAANADQSRALYEAVRGTHLANVVTFNYRGNPLVQQARTLAGAGELGELCFVHGHYLQDWLADEHVWSWRLDPRRGGASSALHDIGSHWCDLAEHVTGLRITAVLAELATVVPLRYGSTDSEHAFAGPVNAAEQQLRVEAEDLASVLLRFERGVRGCVSVGQVLPGHKNDLRLEINGRRASLSWRQEAQNELWIGRYALPNAIVPKDPASLAADARSYAHLPAGHQEGWADAFRNVMADAYRWIRQGAAPQAKPSALATFADGYRSDCLIEAMLKSHGAGGVWQAVPSMPS